MRIFRMSLTVGVLLAVCAQIVPAADRTSKIEAKRGKAYRLTKRHGPWMIMVASLRDIPEDRRVSKTGLSAQEAADELVFALRKHGIPAYTFSQKQVVDQIRTPDRQTGETRHRSYIAQQDRIVVMAGNYPTAENKVAKKTLEYIKGKFQAKELEFLRTPGSGAVYRPTPGRPGPLSRAFLVPNPLLTTAEVTGSKIDPFVLKLNNGDHSLLANPGKYTLVIATFRGKSAIHVNSHELTNIANKLESKVGVTLDDAALNAWRLTQAMRGAQALGYEQDYPVWVYHDRYQSMVTIGSFDDPRDPRIAALRRRFSAKRRPHPRTGQEVLAAEIFAVPRRPPKGKLPEYTWMFDPSPELMEVPKTR